MEVIIKDKALLKAEKEKLVIITKGKAKSKKNLALVEELQTLENELNYKKEIIVNAVRKFEETLGDSEEVRNVRLKDGKVLCDVVNIRDEYLGAVDEFIEAHKAKKAEIAADLDARFSEVNK